VSLIISFNEQEDRLIVELDGDFDNTTSKQAETCLAPVFERTDCDIAFECEKLNYISSSGLRILLNVYKHTRANGHDTILCHLAPDVVEVIGLSGFMQLFKTED
jgi:anti-anti-sigma factor